MEELHTTRVHTPDFSKLTIQTVVSEPQPSHDDSFDLKGDENDAASSDYDSFDEHGYDRPTERWAPLGAAVSPTPLATEPSPYSEHERLRRLEEEQEQLNSSLLALTTHFAQVQFRLKQIVSADSSDREKLLKELEEFAFKGIPDVNSCQVQKDVITNDLSDQEHEEKLAEQRERQRKLITQLKSQLEDLETYAYEARVTCHNAHFYKKTGDAELPTSKVMEKQRVVLEELRHKLDLDLENFDKLSAEELRDIVDHAVQSIVNPAKVKEKLVEQLKTQIVDLERFIEFLQGEASSPGPLGKQRCICPVHHKAPYDDSDEQGDCCGSSKARSHRRDKDKEPTERQAAKGSETTTTLMKKALTVLQIYIISQLGCGSREFKRNLLKRTTKDLRAKLEVAINHTLEVAQQQQQERRQWQDDTSGSDEYTSDTDESEPPSSPALTQCVRKELAMAIRDLMQHGLMEMGQSSNLVQFGCFPNRSAGVTKMIHAWDLLVKFYHMKHGREYNESPARMLSQSFHLDIVGGKPITAKQTLLGAIDTVLKSHAPHRRTADSHFKAFICLALNERKLVTWLRLLFRTQTLIDMYYQDWSYMARTGFEDGLQALERLLVINFHLPVDLAVRPFSNIRDAF